MWALTSSVKVPLAHIGWAEVDYEIAKLPWKGFRVGTGVPGVIVAGYFYLEGMWSFWDVSDPDRVVVIYLHDEPLSKLVVEVEDPYEAVWRIRTATGRG